MPGPGLRRPRASPDLQGHSRAYGVGGSPGTPLAREARPVPCRQSPPGRPTRTHERRNPTPFPRRCQGAFLFRARRSVPPLAGPRIPLAARRLAALQRPAQRRGRLAQLARAPARQAGGRWFKSSIAHHSAARESPRTAARSGRWPRFRGKAAWIAGAGHPAHESSAKPTRLPEAGVPSFLEPPVGTASRGRTGPDPSGPRCDVGSLKGSCSHLLKSGSLGHRRAGQP